MTFHMNSDIEAITEEVLSGVPSRNAWFSFQAAKKAAASELEALVEAEIIDGFNERNVLHAAAAILQAALTAFDDSDFDADMLRPVEL